MCKNYYFNGHKSGIKTWANPTTWEVLKYLECGLRIPGWCQHPVGEMWFSEEGVTSLGCKIIYKAFIELIGYQVLIAVSLH